MRITRSRGLAATGALGAAIAGVVAYAVPATAAGAMAGPSAATRPAAHRPAVQPGDSATPRCRTGDLSVRLRALDPSAGGRHAALTLRNVGHRACHVRGHVGLQLYAGDGSQVPTTAYWAGGRGDRVTLIPGASAFTRLDWGVIPAGDEPVTGPCEPSAAWLSVTPPDQFTQRSVAWPYGPVCEHGAITSGPLSPGIGPVY